MRVVLFFTFFVAIMASCTKDTPEPSVVTGHKILKRVVAKNTDSSETVTVTFEYDWKGRVSTAKKMITGNGKADSIVDIEFDYGEYDLTTYTNITTYLSSNSYMFERISFYNQSFSAYDIRESTAAGNFGKSYFILEDPGGQYFVNRKDSSWYGNYYSIMLDSIPVLRPNYYTIQLSYPPYNSSCIYPYVAKKIYGQLEYGSGSTCNGDTKIIKINYTDKSNLYSKEVWESFAPGERIDRLLEGLVYNGKNPNLPGSQITPSGSEFYEYEMDPYGWIEKIRVYKLNTNTGLKDLKTVYSLYY